MSSAASAPKNQNRSPEAKSATDLNSEHDKAIRLLQAGDFLAALAPLQTVIAAIPGNEQIARSLVRLGRGAAQAALKLSPQDNEARELYECSLAAYLAIGGTITDRVDCGLLRAVCFNLGAHYHGHKLYQEAIRHYRDALVLGPEFDDTPNNLAQVLIEDGQPLEALAMLKTAMQRHPDSATLQHRKEQALKAASRSE